jgi:hypothetical protein
VLLDGLEDAATLEVGARVVVRPQVPERIDPAFVDEPVDLPLEVSR